jgi:predicted transcriptional regulator
VVIIMTSISVTLSNDRLLKLQEIAARLGVTPEELVRVSIEELLARPDDAFQQAADYVLNKNAELYQRLA